MIIAVIQLLQLGKESLKKIPACTGFEPLTSAILVQRALPIKLHRYRRGQGNESRTSRNFFNFSGFLFATAKVANITAMIILHLIRLSAVHII